MAISYEDRLARTSLFSRLTKKQLGEFAAKAQLQTYEAGAVITRQGELSTGLFVILKGSVDVVVNKGEADETHLATLEAGDFFGELALLLSRPRSATIVAREPSDLFSLVRWDFKDLALQNPEVLWTMAETVAERLAEADALLEQQTHN